MSDMELVGTFAVGAVLLWMILFMPGWGKERARRRMAEEVGGLPCPNCGAAFGYDVVHAAILEEDTAMAGRQFGSTDYMIGNGQLPWTSGYRLECSICHRHSAYRLSDKRVLLLSKDD